jgi:hypothetical protein
MRIRKLSPSEVWQAGQRKLTKLRPEHIPTLLGEDLAQEKRLDKHHCFTISGQEYGGSELRFPAARVRNVLNQDVVLDPRHVYMVFATPFDPSQLYICDADYRYIGRATRQIAVSRSDIDAIHRAIGQSEHDRIAMDAPLRGRHAAEAEDRAAMLAANKEVLDAMLKHVSTDSPALSESPVNAQNEAQVDEALRMLEQAQN